MRINTSAMMAQSSVIGRNENVLSKIMHKLSTGKRINSAADDASGRAVAEELLAQTRGLKQSSSNIDDAMSALRIADGATGEISSMLQRQRELAIQASNDTLNDRDREYLDKEYQALTQEIDRISGASQFNTQRLLDGSSPLSDGTGVIHNGPNAGDQLTLDSMNMTAAALGAGGSIATGGDAMAALDRTERAMDSVNSGRATLGARINTLQHNVNDNRNAEINQTQSLSLIEDLDFAQGVMEQSRAGLLTQSSIQAAGNFQDISRSNLSALLS